jgi:hypothetical protein
VGFAEDLELWLGIEDSIKMYKIVVPLELGASGSTPWSSPATQDATSSTRTPAFAAHTDQAGNLNVHRLDTPPSWASPIMDLLNTEGEVDDDEEQPVVFVTSYFIDHHHHRYHDQPRVLRFDSEVNEWERDVRFIWEDLIDQSSAIDVVLVRPDPPFNVYGGTSATVIVHQHFDHLRAAFLITTVHIQDPRTHFHVSAHSAELQLPQVRIHQLAGVEEVCRQRTQAGAGDCTIHAGTFVHPPGQHVATFHGLGLQLRIPSLLSEQEAEQNLVSRVAQQRRQRIPHLWDPPDAEDDPEGQHPRPSNPDPTESHPEPEDTVSLMARRPATLTPQQEPSVTSSASSTSSFVSEDPRRSIVFTIDGRALPVTLSWTDSSEHHSVIAQEHGIALTSIAHLFHVSNRPHDLERADLQCFLMQLTTEPRPSRFLRLIMVDIEIFDDQELQPFALRRYAKWMPMTINRRSVFRMLDLEDQYQKREAHCHLWHNHLSVGSDQTSPLQLEDGDYIQVHIGDEPPSLSCVSDRDLASMNNSNHSSHSADLSMDQEVATLFQLTMYKTEQVWSQFQTWLQTDTWRIAPQHERTGQPIGSHPQGGPLPPQRAFNAHLHFDDRRLFARIFETTSIIECEDEGPIAYLETWYIHHQTHRSCTESRSVRISHDSPSWIEDIVEPWATTIDPALEVTIHLVKPQPPRTNMECIMAHLILEQSSRLEHTVGMISTATSQTPRSQFHHSAHSLPDIMNQAYVLRQAGLHEVCRDGRCRVRLGNIPFGLFDWDDFPRASSLTIHREQFSFSSHAASHEVLDLMQRTAIRWRRRSTDQHGSSAQQPGGGCTNFTFNPHARPFDPATPHIASVPENVQELHQLWSRTAFSWQGEEASTIVMTWLVDQYHPGLRTCLQPRPVRLYSDFRQWTMQLRSVWPDRAITGAPIMLHVVTPQPPNLHPNVAAHVILVQNPQDSLSSALFTGFDGSLPQPGPFMQLVATTHEHFRLDQLLVFIGLGGRCIFPGATMICRAWYDLFQIHIDRPFPLRDGHGIVIHLSLRPTQPQTGVGNSLLQRGHQAITKVNLTHFDQESAPCERQTADTVAHDQRPQDRLEIFSTSRRAPTTRLG